MMVAVVDVTMDEVLAVGQITLLLHRRDAGSHFGYEGWLCCCRNVLPASRGTVPNMLLWKCRTVLSFGLHMCTYGLSCRKSFFLVIDSQPL